MNAPIRYFGGKGTMFNEIIERFPVKDSYRIYIEPFGGTYSVGFHMPYVPPVEIYNDLERNVYSLYHVLRDDGLYEKFAKAVNLIPFSEDERREAKEKLKDESISLLDRAISFFVVNRMSHNGIGGISLNMIVRRNMSKSVSDYLSAVDRLPEVHQRLSRVMVLNRDAIELMERYSSHDVFMYCDPPYVWDTRGATRYSVDNDNEWHKRFVQTCIASKSKILISGYEHEIYEELERNGFKKIKFDVHTIDGNLSPKTKTEVLWKNY
jgi:DNA adenine methylase